MPWTLPQVKNYLLKEYKSLLEPSTYPEFAAWVSALIADKEENFQARRLACCLALDTYHKLIDKKTYKLIFESMDYSIPGRRLVSRFKIAAREHQQKLWSCVSNCHKKPSKKHGRYSVIMRRERFVKLYENWDPATKSKSKDDLAREDYRKYLDGKAYGECSPVIDTHWAFWVGWVFPNAELKSHDAAVVCNCLGLIGYENEVLVRLTYPEDFDELVHHPCAAEAEWGNENLYMSFDKKKDAFGRTRCRSHDDPDKRMKERVHSPPQGKKYTYTYSYLEAHPLTPINWKNIIKECLHRF